MTVTASNREFTRALCGLLVLLATAQAGLPAARAQGVYDDPAVLRAYVAEGLASNLQLRQQSLDLEKSLHALAEARGQFFPRISVEARYSVAGGGRRIAFPAGDLLNPVYATLNEYLDAQGRPAVFPTLENQEIALLRGREQETRLRLVQPVYNPSLPASVRLRRAQAGAQAAGLDVYRRTLARDIRVAYYTYLKATGAVEIYDAAARLVAENLRTNESLVRHAKATRDAALRAQAEVYAVAQQSAEAGMQQRLAQRYLNFLLNRAAEAPVERVSAERLGLSAGAAAGEAAFVPAALQPAPGAAALALRPELRQLDAALDATAAGVALAGAAYRPTAAVAVDLGLQGERYELGGDGPFYLASVVLAWELFDGRQRRARLAQARLDAEQVRLRREETEDLIRMQVQEAQERVAVARATLRAAEERTAAAREGFRLVARQYDEGLTTQVAYVDARTTFTGAELNLNIARTDLLIRLAELSFALGEE